MAKITVTAGEGRVTPIHHSIETAPGGGQLRLKPGDELEVDDAHTSVARGRRNGDLVLVTNPRPRPPGVRFSPAPTPAALEHEPESIPMSAAAAPSAAAAVDTAPAKVS